MSDLRELYQQLIIDHGRHPRNFGAMADANHCLEGFNPLCGDRLKLYIKEQDQRIVAIQFEGEGCAISMASASLMTEALKGQPVAQAQALFKRFHRVVTGDGEAVDIDSLGKLSVLAGVADYPMRIKCATLCWHALMGALQDQQQAVSTESTE